MAITKVPLQKILYLYLYLYPLSSLMRHWFHFWLGLGLLGLGMALAGCQTPTADSAPVGMGRFQLPTQAAVAVAEALPIQTYTPAPTASATLPATFTPIPTITNTPPPGATNTPTPTKTPLPTATATASPTIPPPTPTLVFLPALTATLTTSNTVQGGFTPVPTIPAPQGTTNILLLGNDSDPATGITSARTDTLIIVSVNTSQQTAAMLSIPRDLYVSVPGWIPNRINTVYGRGESSGYTGGGSQLLKDTILYNMGIHIDYYARVDFDSFENIVDALGGVEVAVSCPLTDWRLIEPDMDIQDPDSWEWYTLEPGIHTLDGHKSLWYVRSRLTTSDFDRGRRQQQVLRAMFNKGVDLNLITQAPTLWNTYQQAVDTDLTLTKMLQLATIASAVRQNGIQHIYLTQGELQAWTHPETGAQLQLLNQSTAAQTFAQLYQTPSINRANRTPITVEVLNATGSPDMARLAAENLRWYGFVPIWGEEIESAPTRVTYYGNNFKGSYHWLVSWVFGKGMGQVVLDEATESPYNYQVIIGPDYNPCRNPLYAPRPSGDS